MGAGAAKQPTAPLLDRLTGREPIPSDDRFWQELLASAVSLPAGSSVEDVTAISRAYCAELVRNNPRSGNFGALAAAMAERLGRATRSAATDTEMQQACGAVFLLRIFLKHMLETLEPEDVALQLRGRDVAAAAQAPGSASAAAEPVQARPPGGSEDTEAAVARLIVEALLGAAASCRLDDVSYALHMEVLAALTVCLSAQLFSELSASVPLPTVTAALGAPPPLAEALVARLLKLYIDQPPRPANPEGRLLGSIGSMLWLPLQVIASFFRAQEPPVELADRSLQVLLLLTQHLPPALFPDPMLSNHFLAALRCVGDADSACGSGAEAEEGRARQGAGFSVRRLHDALCARLPEEATLVLLYLLLHGNRELLDHALSRSDPDALLLPLLRTLAGMLSPACRLRTSRVYMLLIILLMLSQDGGFVSTAHAVMLPTVPWFKERLLHDISVGSLLVVVLVRTTQYNLSRLQDLYVQTNCLAALANMAPCFKRIHPYAARSLVTLYDVLARRFQKLEARRAHASPVELADSEELSDEALGSAADFLRMALEVLNVALAAQAGLQQNEHLVYAILERQRVFAALRGHELFWDLIENVFRVIDHFGAGLSGQGPASTKESPLQLDKDSDRRTPPLPTTARSSSGSDGVWSVDLVLAHIGEASRSWKADSLEHVPDPRFTYEQESAPEEFFTPYIWSLVRDRSGLVWDPLRVVLLAEELDDEPADALPALLQGVDVVEDVDEHATAPGPPA